MRDLDRDTTIILDLIERRLGADLAAGRRRVVAIAGPPASGKSTLAARVVEGINRKAGDTAALLPMDGFHLDNATLDARGLRQLKGAPDTFDADGFVALVRHVRQGNADIRYPLFDRAQDRTLPGAGFLPEATPLVVVEGNYLLLRQGAWAGLSNLFDLTVMLAPPLAELEARLIARWRHHGLAPAAAEARARGNDLTNARTVMTESAEADLFLGDSHDTEDNRC
ncbi:uridine kinase [Oceaniglobus indicus]|uniref:uridine kinase n=1 Tax=Oceaniglobus indicus TaxID=2047749 RepID=UPI001F4EA07F|nr:uridine kinase [Oceaniglobus indicus]